MPGDYEQQIAVLRGLTDKTQAIHDAQVFQLKNWGILAFPHLKAGQWEILVDPQKRKVAYNIARATHPSNFAILVASLDMSVKWLFGPKWTLDVVEADKPLYIGQVKNGTGNKGRGANKNRAKPKRKRG